MTLHPPPTQLNALMSWMSSCSLVPVCYKMIQGSERFLYSSSQPSHSCHLRHCSFSFVWPVPLSQQQHKHISGEPLILIL